MAPLSDWLSRLFGRKPSAQEPSKYRDSLEQPTTGETLDEEQAREVDAAIKEDILKRDEDATN